MFTIPTLAQMSTVFEGSQVVVCGSHDIHPESVGLHRSYSNDAPLYLFFHKLLERLFEFCLPEMASMRHFATDAGLEIGKDASGGIDDVLKGIRSREKPAYNSRLRTTLVLRFSGLC